MKKRLIQVILCVSVLVAGTLLPQLVRAKGSKSIVYVGTFTGASSKGIYAWRFDSTSGKMEPLGLVAETTRPSFLVVHPNRRFLYAVGRPTSPGGPSIGVVLAYAVDTATGSLKLLNTTSSRGVDPTYLSVDRKGKNLLVANYNSGSVAVLPILKDGSLGETSEFIQYSGSSVHPQRQQGPHSHAINLSPDNRFAFVADLGLDKLFVYRFDSQRGKLTPNNPPAAALNPGAGPRHFTFHPGGRYVYVINEIQSTLTTFSYDARAGALKELQTVTTLPADFTGTSTAAEVQVHPNGKFVYGSNRGHDSIAVFSVNVDTGQLTLVELVPSQGKTPRNFSIDPSGSWLIVGNQDSNSLVTFRIDPKTGTLQATGQSFQVGTPSCLRFLAVN
ncbi:MAG: lactonase family protein [Pyrinomonadaceae bacterium]|nr:lactonase family protein [Pyrinomonadaceae bacterium]